MSGYETLTICLYTLCAVIWAVAFTLIIINRCLEKRKREEQINQLQNRIDVLEFMQKNPSGMRVCYEENDGSPYIVCHPYKKTYIKVGVEFVRDGKLDKKWLDDTFLFTTDNQVRAELNGTVITVKDDKKNVLCKAQFDPYRYRFVYIIEVEKNDDLGDR